MRSIIAIPIAVLLLAACGGEHTARTSGGTSSTADDAAAVPSTSTAEALASLPEESRVPFAAMMAGYRSMQAALASDTTAGIDAAAPAVAGAARLLETGASEPSKALYAGIATEAGNVAANSTDIVEARKSFGELSKAMISLLVANPDLAKGNVVVECPMTSTYKKWLQTDENVRNPYYGSTMLECGTISKLEL